MDLKMVVMVVRGENATIVQCERTRRLMKRQNLNQLLRRLAVVILFLFWMAGW